MRTGNIVPLVLAAGKGVRMKSAVAKVAHSVNGKSMVARVVGAAGAVTEERPRVVIGAGADLVREALEDCAVHWIYQKEQLGTGHAVLQAREDLYDTGFTVLILSGDTPLLRPQTLEALIEHHRDSGAAATLVSTELDDPTGYGRVIRSQHSGDFVAIVEHKDAGPKERRVNEINAGLYLIDARLLFSTLQRVGSSNEQGEYYLTDVFTLLAEDGEKVEALLLSQSEELLGVNSRRQLAEADAVIRRRVNVALMDQGVSIIDPDRTYIHDDVSVGRDTIIAPGVHLENGTCVGANCSIGVGSIIKGSKIGDDVNILPYTLVEDAQIYDGVTAGPFSRIRPGSRLLQGCKTGNFVELKNTTLGEDSKASHLAYLGDSQIGTGVNIGAGTITCNYDGVRKHRTEIADGVFIGSNSTLVAPISIDERAYVAAGSTVNSDVPAEALAIGRGRQVNKEGYRGKLDKRFRDGGSQ